MRSSLVSFPERSQCSSHRLKEGCQLCNVTEGRDLPYKAESLRSLHQSATEPFIQLCHIQASKTFIISGNRIRTSIKHCLLFFKHVKSKHKRVEKLF